MSYNRIKDDFLTMDLTEMRPKGFLKNILVRQKNNFNAVEKNQGWKKREVCPVCQSNKKIYLFDKFELHLYQCEECETAYFNYVPVNTNDVYSSTHALEDAKNAYLTNKDYRKERFANERIKLIEEFTEGELRGKNILDVGCGTGWFLEVVKEHGANCFGVELGKDLAEFTSNRLNIHVWNSDLVDVKTDVKFDVITMFDLIEHVKDPVSLIQGAKKLLNKEGLILIFTPQFDSVAIQTMKEKSNLVMPAEHLSYFTKMSIQKIAQLSNMELVYYVTKGIDLGDLKSFYEYNNQPLLEEAISTLYNIIQPVIDASETGNHLRAILKNNNYEENC